MNRLATASVGAQTAASSHCLFPVSRAECQCSRWGLSENAHGRRPNLWGFSCLDSSPLLPSWYRVESQLVVLHIGQVGSAPLTMIP